MKIRQTVELLVSGHRHTERYHLCITYSHSLHNKHLKCNFHTGIKQTSVCFTSVGASVKFKTFIFCGFLAFLMHFIFLKFNCFPTNTVSLHSPFRNYGQRFHCIHMLHVPISKSDSYNVLWMSNPSLNPLWFR